MNAMIETDKLVPDRGSDRDAHDFGLGRVDGNRHFDTLGQRLDHGHDARDFETRTQDRLASQD